MQNHIPGHITEEQYNQMLLPPESFAAKPESLTEQLFVERSLTENKFWLRIMKEHALFLGEGFNQKDKNPSWTFLSVLQTTREKSLSSSQQCIISKKIKWGKYRIGASIP